MNKDNESDKFQEPEVPYESQSVASIPDYVNEHIRKGIEQADKGLLISFEMIMSSYR